MDKLGKIFMLDDDIFFLNLYHDLLEKRGFDVFTTTNAYQFLMYAKEVHPDVFVLDVNMPDACGWEVFHLLDEEAKNRAPVIMTTVASDKGLAVAKGVAHYLRKPVKMDNLLELLEAYCLGKKQHDILLISEYHPFTGSVRDAINEFGFSCFEVNDLKAARFYLHKNRPKAVCINFSEPYSEEIKSEIEHDHIFCVENRSHIEKLASFLK